MIVTVVEGDPFPGLIVGFTAEDVAEHDGLLPEIDLPELMAATNTFRPPVILQVLFAQTHEELTEKMRSLFSEDEHDIQLLGEPGDTLGQVQAKAIEFSEKHERLAAAGTDDDTRQQNIAASHAIRASNPSLN